MDAIPCGSGCGGTIRSDFQDQFFCVWCQRTVCNSCRYLMHDRNGPHGACGVWWDDRDELRYVEHHALSLLDALGLGDWPEFDRVCKLPNGRRALLLRTLDKGVWRPCAAAVVEIDEDADVNDSGDLVDYSKAVSVEFKRWLA